MNHKGQPCSVRERQGKYKLCQEGECELCNISIEMYTIGEKQLDHLRAMKEAYKGRK